MKLAVFKVGKTKDCPFNLRKYCSNPNHRFDILCKYANETPFHCPLPDAECNEDIYKQLLALTDEERSEIFHMFCTHCGADDPGCQCWNDE